MNSVIPLLGLEPVLRGVPAVAGRTNFEDVYSSIAEDKGSDHIRSEIEQRVFDYFDKMRLPSTATLYDALVLSLTASDAILTFNWDPFLFDAWERNRYVAAPPAIFFLHGNVRLEFCQVDRRPLKVGTLCPACGQRGASLPLLYPTSRKNYSADPGIAEAWTAAAHYLKECLTLTIFGYGAPTTDVDAVNLLKDAWLSRSKRQFEHVQLINVDDRNALYERWKDFTPTGHLDVVGAFHDCRVAQWPRRSVQALQYPMSTGLPAEQFPIPMTSNLADLRTFAREIAQHDVAAP